MIEIIGNEFYNYEEIQQFSNMWNEYSDGHSSQKLIQTLYESHHIPKDHSIKSNPVTIVTGFLFYCLIKKQRVSPETVIGYLLSHLHNLCPILFFCFFAS
ncbi:hypothetical protein [Halobacillus andaensis]|uniref:hypothetical protein n=1 Tax=Halobacillus andaensis TaxID=1176239 RepID=UPI003D74B30F